MDYIYTFNKNNMTWLLKKIGDMRSPYHRCWFQVSKLEYGIMTSGMFGLIIYTACPRKCVKLVKCNLPSPFLGLMGYCSLELPLVATYFIWKVSKDKTWKYVLDLFSKYVAALLNWPDWSNLKVYEPDFLHCHITGKTFSLESNLSKRTVVNVLCTLSTHSQGKRRERGGWREGQE